MTAAGVQFEESPHKEPYGQVAVFQDPFGNRWDLLQLSSYFRIILNIDKVLRASHT